MQRSRSSSNIPLPTFKRTLSSENLKSSQPGLKRSGSYGQFSVRNKVSATSSSKREKSSLLGSCTKSVTTNASKKSICTPLSTRPGIPRQSSRIPSPGQALSTPLTSQKINDKKYSAEQYRKVCAFLEPLMEDFDPKALKSLTVKSFVWFITILFQEIDPRININLENYKEIIIKYMKMYKYPGQVSMSLLKSVNIPHSWAPVMALFGWLVDLIYHFKGDVYENDKLKKFLSTRVTVKYQGGQVKGLLLNLIDEMIGLDRNEFNNLQMDVQRLESEVKEKRAIVTSLQDQDQILHEEINRMEMEIKEFKEEKTEKKIKQDIEQLETELKNREIDIEKLKVSKAKIKEIVANQKYSLKVKRDLEKEIEDKIYSLNTKKNSLENVKKLKDKYDFEQTNYRRQLETEVLKVNESLMRLKLSLVHGDGKIQLPDRGFHSEHFLEIVEEKRQQLLEIKKKLQSELTEVKSHLSNVQEVRERNAEEIEKLKEENAAFEAKIHLLKTESERITFESEILRQENDKKVQNLMKNSPDVEATEKKKDKLQKELLALNEKLEKLSEQSIDIFRQIYSDTKKSAAEMRTIMAEVLKGSGEAFIHVMNQQQHVLNKLHEALEPNNVIES